MKKRISLWGVLALLLLTGGIATACKNTADDGAAAQKEASAAEAWETEGEALREESAAPEDASGAGSDAEGEDSSAAKGSAAQETATAGEKPAQDRAGNDIAVPDEVDVIISLAPATTQVLCDLGLTGKIAAVDTNSPQYVETLPEEILQFDLLKPDLEQIVSMEPDIVFVSNLSSQGGEDIFRAVRENGICVAEIPTADTLADIAEDVRFIAGCVGMREEGKSLTDAMEKKIEEVSVIGGKITEQKTVLFEISPLPYLYSFGEGVYLNEMLSLIGAQNILKDQEGWLSVTEESAVSLNPDVILTSDNFSGGDPVAEILSRPGWENVTAVKEKAVGYIDNAASSLPNQHITEALLQMAKAVYPEEYADLR